MISITIAIAAATAVSTPLASARRPYSCTRIRGIRWYQCFGAVRGLGGLIAELDKPRPPSSVIHLLGVLGERRAAEPLRRILKAASEKDGRWRLRPAIEALAALRDRPSMPALARLAGELNSDALLALLAIEPEAARKVALQIAGKMAMPPTRAGIRFVPELLEVFEKTRAREALPTLRRWAGILNGQKWILRSLRRKIEVARIRLGDADAGRKIRKAVLRRRRYYSYYHRNAVDLLKGRPADLALIRRFVRSGGRQTRAVYDAVEELVRAKHPKLPRLRGKLRKLLRSWTSKREAFAGRRNDRALLVRHYAALASLGDGAARTRLDQLLEDDPDDAKNWVAARYALGLGLPRAANAAATLLASAVRSRSRYRGSKERTALLEAAARRFDKTDARWTVALLDPDRRVREKALFLFARQRPRGACDAVTSVAAVASRAATEDALVALTVLGDACRTQIRRLATDQKLAVPARGTALEVLAMMRERGIEPLAASLEGVSRFAGLYARRARQILAFISAGRFFDTR